MTYYPVLIPTLNRYEHFKRCVESLARCTSANQTELVLGLDFPPTEKYVAGYNQLKEYIPTIKGFKKITCFEHKANLGPNSNCEFLCNYASAHYDAYIYTEDDNEFSPCFLEFINKALEKYADDPQITSVCGYPWNNLTIRTDKNVFFAPAFCAFGYGAWFNKPLGGDIDYYFDILKSPKKAWKCLMNRPSSFNLIIEMIKGGYFWGDASFGLYSLFEEKLAILPTLPLVRNWGDDGSGLHCGGANILKERVISLDRTFNIDDIDKTVNPDVLKGLRKFFNSNMSWGRYLRSLARVVFKYVCILPCIAQYRKKYDGGASKEF